MHAHIFKYQIFVAYNFDYTFNTIIDTYHKHQKVRSYRTVVDAVMHVSLFLVVIHIALGSNQQINLKVLSNTMQHTHKHTYIRIVKYSHVIAYKRYLALCCAIIMCHKIIDLLIGCTIGVHNCNPSVVNVCMVPKESCPTSNFL